MKPIAVRCGVGCDKPFSQTSDAATGFQVIQRALAFIALLAFAFGTIICEPVLATETACVPAASEIGGHFEGDSDESSHPGGKEAAHHHAPCAGHPAATTRPDASENRLASALAFALPAADAGRPLANGFENLRPPIA